MNSSKLLKNTMVIVEKYLSESLQKFFNIEGKVTAQMYSKTDDFDYQSPYAMMYFKRVQSQGPNGPFGSVDDLASYLKEKLTLEYPSIFSKIDICEKFLLLQIHEQYLVEQVNNLIQNGVMVQNQNQK